MLPFCDALLRRLSLDWILKSLPLPPSWPGPSGHCLSCFCIPPDPGFWRTRAPQSWAQHLCVGWQMSPCFPLILSSRLFAVQFQSSPGHRRLGAETAASLRARPMAGASTFAITVLQGTPLALRRPLGPLQPIIWGLSVPKSLHPNPQGKKCSDYSCQMV